MSESPLRKVLRLAGGVTKSYVHTVNGRPVAVHQYPTPHPAQPQMHQAMQGTLAFGHLKKGMVVDINNQRYRVAAVNLPPHKSGVKTPAPAKPKSPGTTSGKATGSQGQGVNTAKSSASAQKAAAAQSAARAAALARVAAKLSNPAAQQNPQKAALGGKPVPSGTPTVTHELVNTVSGFTWFVTLPTSYAVRVVS